MRGDDKILEVFFQVHQEKFDGCVYVCVVRRVGSRTPAEHTLFGRARPTR